MKGYTSISNLDVVFKMKCSGCGKTIYEPAGLDVIKDRKQCGKCGYSTRHIVDTLIKTPRLILFCEGGVVHDVMSESEAVVAVVDYDIESDGEIKKFKLPGSDNDTEAYVARWKLNGVEDLEPFFKQEAFK